MGSAARGRRRRRFTRGALITGAILTVVCATTPAAAQTSAQNRTIHPDGQWHTVITVPVEADAGEKWHVQGRVQLEDAEARLLVGERLRCDAQTGLEVRTTQNTYTGQERAVLRARYIFTAPAAGTYQCEMLVRVAYPSTLRPPADVLLRGSGTSLEVRPAPGWARHKYQELERVIRRNRPSDLAVMSWTPPDSVSRFDLTGDIEYTNCYNTYHACNTVPSNGNQSVVESRLQALQLATNGGYCRVTSSASRRLVVSWAVHHRKTYHRLHNISVSGAAECTRRFRLKVHTRWVSGNPMMTELGPWSNLYVTD